MGRARGFFLLLLLATAVVIWPVNGYETTSADPWITFAIDADPFNTPANDGGTLGTIQDCRRVDVTTGFDATMDTQIDVVVFDTPEPPAPLAYDANEIYDNTKVRVTDAGTDPLMKMPHAVDFTTDECPGDPACTSDLYKSIDGVLYAAAAYMTLPSPATPGNGAIVRIGLDIDGTGAPYVTTLGFDWPTDYTDEYGNPLCGVLPPPSPACNQVTGMLAVNMDCPVPVGGIAELPDTREGDSLIRNYPVLAALAAAAFLALTAAAWYARRRWLG